ncbi:MAG: motility protein A [Spirochaetales bacterium]|nr:motility protein A [Spirochaetales bacterium]
MQRSLDIGSVLGALFGAACVVIGIVVNGADVTVYMNLSSVFITIGGSFGAMMITHPLNHILNIPRFLGIIFFVPKFEEERIITQLVAFSEKARRDGILALEDDLESIEDDFLRQGIQLVVDGTDPEIIKTVLFTELNKIEERHEKGSSLFDDWGKTAPAFGMIGTLMGLVAMLVRLEDKSAIGSGMAQALLTTLYGAVLAYLFLLPFRRRLEERNKEETLVKEIMIEGVLAIQSGDNPRILEEKLLAFLPPERRETIRQENIRE